MQGGFMTVDGMLASLREAQRRLALSTAGERNAALYAAAAAIDGARAAILRANEDDRARATGMKAALVERLALDEKKVDGIVAGLETVAALPDPLGRVKAGWTLPNGLLVEQVSVPIGVAAIIYESRPNVTADAFALAYKAGCSMLLRGSSAAVSSNRAIVAAIKQGLEQHGIPGAVELASSGDRSEVAEILGARGKVDVVIPRGGHSLIKTVVENARVPVIETGEGNCHIYVEPDYDPEMAAAVIANAKLQRPGACNAVETVLIHKDALAALMPVLARTFAGKAELRADPSCIAAIHGGTVAGLALKPASEGDWATEFLDYILAVKKVDSIDEAIAHINRYGTGHSEAILTENIARAAQFRREVDAACVYVNASTRFTDGGEFGFGCELGISTQKFHARGPMGLDALTTTKYLVSGSGQVR
ncbi:MAG: glutamate-5-semialdehyde dehydrogenase [Spirochaetaceae bacterium]|nr:glutamate-5-semialdehyde dehydrogenase [Spirochaetaceae bacterium]